MTYSLLSDDVLRAINLRLTLSFKAVLGLTISFLASLQNHSIADRIVIQRNEYPSKANTSVTVVLVKYIFEDDLQKGRIH